MQLISAHHEYEVFHNDSQPAAGTETHHDEGHVRVTVAAQLVAVPSESFLSATWVLAAFSFPGTASDLTASG